MLLSNEQIYDLAFGVQDHMIDENGLYLMRFPKNYRDFIDELQDYAAPVAGIHLSFETDAEELILKFRFTALNAAPYRPSFDIYHQHILSEHISFENTLNEELTLTVRPGDPGLTEIWFPIHAVIYIQSLELNECSYCRRSDRYKKKCMFFGDSIIQGFSCEYPSLTVASALSRFYDMEILNLGIGGYSYRKGFVQKYRFDPDVIMVFLGTNDCSYQPAEKRDPIGFYKKLNQLYPGIPTVCITPFYRFLDHNKSLLDEIVSEVKQCVRRYDNLTLIDGLTVSSRLRDFYDDGLHPNLQGMQYISCKLIRALESVFQEISNRGEFL